MLKKCGQLMLQKIATAIRSNKLSILGCNIWQQMNKKIPLFSPANEKEKERERERQIKAIIFKFSTSAYGASTILIHNCLKILPSFNYIFISKINMKSIVCTIVAI